MNLYLSARRITRRCRQAGRAVALCAVIALAGCGGGDRPGGGSRISDCMEPRQARSTDVRRNLRALGGAPICYRRQEVREGGRRWVFHLLEHRKAPQGPFWVLPHDNEDAAFDAGVQALLRYGGGLLAVDTGGHRSHRGQDPNRNFAAGRAEARLCGARQRRAPVYTRSVLEHYRSGKRDGRGPYLALHNNGDGHAGNGGYGNISLHRSGPGVSAWPGRGGGARALGDEDNLVFTASTRSPGSDPALRRRIAALNRAGLNVLHKQVTPGNFDCSLSDYIARHRLGDYYNIEAQHGARAAQVEMVDRLMAVLGIAPLRGKARSNPFLALQE